MKNIIEIKKVPDCEGYYATIDGEIITTNGGSHFVHQTRTDKGYCLACVNGKSIGVHRIIAQTFPEICGKWFEGCEVDHIDTNPSNNNAFNLKVCTHSQNANNILTHINRRNINTKEGYEVGMYTRQGILIKTFPSCREAGRETGITSNNINRSCNGLRIYTGKRGGPKYMFKWIKYGSTLSESVPAN